MDPPEGSKPIECKWIFKKKIDADGNVTVYKVDLSQKGFDKFKELTTRRLSLQ